MNKIIILDENTSNQIAAGEVIERPASVVKELIENSIDANSKNIIIEIKKGGVSLIRIIDDGEGIGSDDVEMAFERHGTSKIRSAKDLNSINTMGFRGEALASIASVADITIKTRIKEEQYGTLLNIKGGDLVKKESIAKQIGTIFEIKSLFYNTPARYKFLKNDSTETRYCSEIITKIALANPSIAFTFISNKIEVLKTPGDDKLVNTIYSIYGKEIANSLYSIDYEYNGMRVFGYIGKQNISRGNRANQSVFINARNIKSIDIIKAVEKAYESTLMKGRYPFYVINIDINTSLVDVNVHPTKSEVRFSNRNDVFSLVYRGVKSVIDRTNTIYESKPIIRQSNDTFNEPQNTYIPSYPVKEQYHEQMKLVKEQFNENEPTIIPEVTKKDIRNSELIGDYSIIGQLFNTYIVLQRDDDILLLDQHACHERITYENLLNKFYKENITKQILLIPVEIRLTVSEINGINENKERINKLGFDYDQFSENSILLRSVPNDIRNENAITVFKSAIDNLDKDNKETLYMMACKNAIKANMKLSNKEINAIVEQLSKMKNPFNCPHGRPTITKMTKYELEKKFKRVI